MHLDALLQMSRDHLNARDLSEERFHETLRFALDKIEPSAAEIVRPIGSGAKVLTIQNRKDGSRTEIDEPMADAIRARPSPSQP